MPSADIAIVPVERPICPKDSNKLLRMTVARSGWTEGCGCAQERVHIPFRSDLDMDPANTNVRDIWSDGEVLWAVDETGRRVYVYPFADKITAGVSVIPTSLTIDEGGSDTYTVKLTTAPTGSVTITPTVTPTNTDVTTDQATLTFTTSNWNTAQTVTVSAARTPTTWTTPP